MLYCALYKVMFIIFCVDLYCKSMLCVEKFIMFNWFVSDIQISAPPYVNIGDIIELTCNASTLDFPTDDIDWFIDGKELKDNYKINIDKHVSLVDKFIHSTLTVLDAKLADAGTYVCRTSDRQITSTKVHVLSGEIYNIN